MGWECIVSPPFFVKQLNSSVCQASGTRGRKIYSVMSRNRRISYQWRLFFPLVITLWVLLLGMAGWQYFRERKYRRQFISEQLALINERIVETINSGDRGDLNEFLDFIGEYYDRNVLFDDVRVTVYDSSWNCVDTVGLRIILDPEERDRVEMELIERRVDKDGTRNVGELGKQEYFYMGKTSNNGMKIIAALPKSEQLSKYLAGDTLEVWIIVFVLVLGMTVICYFSTRYLGRNIRILRNLAERSANDPGLRPAQTILTTSWATLPVKSCRCTTSEPLPVNAPSASTVWHSTQSKRKHAKSVSSQTT